MLEPESRSLYVTISVLCLVLLALLGAYLVTGEFEFFFLAILDGIAILVIC